MTHLDRTWSVDRKEPIGGIVAILRSAIDWTCENGTAEKKPKKTKRKKNKEMCWIKDDELTQL